MDFVQNIVGQFSSGGGRQEEFVEERTTEYYNAGPAQQGPPLPRPWVAQWTEREQRWWYVNQETGQGQWERPMGYDNYGGGYGGGYGGPGGYETTTTEYVQEDRYVEEQAPRNNHGLAYGAMGAAAGVVGGALLMNEGENIREDWDETKYRVEDNVENFPENAAEWTGEKIGHAEYDVEEIKDDVEDFPENAAEWVGDKVGGIERFGDEIRDSYDDGRAEGRDGW